MKNLKNRLPLNQDIKVRLKPFRLYLILNQNLLIRL